MSQPESGSYLGDILVVDDKPENLRLLSTLLNERGYECRAVLSGMMALRAIQSKIPDLILLDIMMPQMDGYEVCKKLKESPKTAPIPIIFLSAKDEVFDKVKAFALGAVDYISKPFQVEEVLARIQNQLTLRKLQAQLQQQNLLLQQEIAGRLSVEKVLQEKNILLQQEINDRLEIQKTLQEKNLLLEKEITHRHQVELTLQHMNQQLVYSHAELEKFAEIVSHDLPISLSTILSDLQQLKDELKPSLDEKAYESIEEIIKHSHSMKTLINNLVEYSKISTHLLSFESCNCQEIIEEVRSHLSGLIEEFQAVLTVKELPIIPADHSQLFQLFKHLIEKGIQSYGKTRPVLEISAVLEENHWLFTIRDNRKGVDIQESQKTLEIEKNLLTKTQDFGTGISLTICQKIVQSHGGNIWVDSPPDGGSNFYFTLPNHLENIWIEPL